MIKDLNRVRLTYEVVFVMQEEVESTHRVQTSAKECVLARNIKLVQNVEIRFLTKTIWYLANNSKVALFRVAYCKWAKKK